MDNDSDMELQPLNQAPDNNNDAGESKDAARAENGSNHNIGASERASLQIQVPENNGERQNLDQCEAPKTRINTTKQICDTIKTKLNEPVGRLKLWMIILIILAFIAFIILISVLVCRAPKVDVDEKYNVDEFVVSRLFKGNFTLQKLVLDPHSNSSNDLTHLQLKLYNFYRTSFALERYFITVKIQPARTNGTTVDYELEFRIPEEHTQLVNYTLSREVVYHVLLQNLYDQEEDTYFIIPTSLYMDVIPL